MNTYGIPERSALIALMTLNGETANPELKKRFNINLKKPLREKLSKDGLISCRKKPGQGSSWFLTLTEKGWNWLESELESPVPPRSGSAAGALYAILNSLKPILAAQKMTLRDFFSGTRLVPAAAPKTADLSAQIAGAYRKLAKQPGSWVELIDLRKELAQVPRKALDQALLQLYQDRKINLTLHDHQANVTAAHTQAALRLGVDDMHLVSIRGPL